MINLLNDEIFYWIVELNWIIWLAIAICALLFALLLLWFGAFNFIVSYIYLWVWELSIVKRWEFWHQRYYEWILVSDDILWLGLYAAIILCVDQVAYHHKSMWGSGGMLPEKYLWIRLYAVILLLLLNWVACLQWRLDLVSSLRSQVITYVTLGPMSARY